MDNIQDILTFPFRDRHSWTQFLIACAIMLAAFIIPILPAILLMGYIMKIMRQVILQKESPSMPAWQGSDWSAMLMDGLKLYGAQFVLMLPLVLFLGCGIIFLVSGSVGFSALADESTQSFVPVAGLLFFIGIGLTLVFSLLALPYGIVISAAIGHVAAKDSFSAAFEFREWWQIFRSAMGHFIVAYVFLMAASFAFALVMQIAMVTIVLMCIIPLLSIPYSVYLMIMSNALYAQAYARGLENLQTV